MTRRTRPDGPAVFASTAVALACIAFVAAAVVAWRVGDRSPVESALAVDATNQAVSDDAAADRAADIDTLVAGAARAMAVVTSVEFRLARSGGPVFIDQFGRIALDRLRGQFSVPNRARAELTVTVNGDLTTKLGAVAIDEEVWISNPVTGDFETLPEGYDIDPSRFFDPENGWQPLLAGLIAAELIGVEDRGGERYHVRGTAPAAQVRDITVGLVRDQDVAVDLWIHPATLLVTAAEFTTRIDDDASDWVLVLDHYGDDFTIMPPENVSV